MNKVFFAINTPVVQSNTLLLHPSVVARAIQFAVFLYLSSLYHSKNLHTGTDGVSMLCARPLPCLSS